MREPKGSRAVSLIAVIASIALFTWSCSIDGQNSASVRLVFEEASADTSRGIAIDGVATDLATFTIEGTGPSGQTVLQTVDSTQTTVTISDLLPGEWTFTVEALNSSAQSILIGTATVYLTSGVTEAVSITLAPLAGDGTLTVEYNWVPSTLTDPVATLIVDPDGDTGADPPVVDVSASDSDFSDATTWDPTNGVASFERTVASGYYYMYTSLENGVSDPAWSGMNHVRILSGYSTTVSVDIETGDVSIEIILDPQDPLTVSLSNVENPLTDGSMTVTANVAETGTFTYGWYLDGAPVSADAGTPSQITLSGLAAGRYTLSVVASGTNTLGSAWVAFDVVP